MSADPILKLFPDGDETPPPPAVPPQEPPASGLSPGMTLSEFFAKYFRPIFLDGGRVSPRTLKQYLESLAYWSAFTGDPPLDAITVLTVAVFINRLRELPGMEAQSKLAENTVRKHVITIQAILDRAGPWARDGKHSRNAELLKRVPIIEKPPVEIGEVEDVFTLGEFSAYMSACRFAGEFCRLSRSIALVCYNCGPRIGTAMGLRWSWLKQDELGWWFNVPSRVKNLFGGNANKTHRPLRMYVNAAARAALEPMHGLRRLPLVDPDWVFPFPFQEGALHALRRRILAASGIAQPRHMQLGYHAFRKAGATELTRINAAAASLFLGHAKGRDVTLDHYTHRRVLSEACDRLPQPTWLDCDGPRQLDLWDLAG